ncbi:MAG: DNA-binding protein Alba [Nanoarchaeota archaeon]|nr:DNA-binding protein Alba [Nanoarchaeota archaeon]
MEEGQQQAEDSGQRSEKKYRKGEEHTVFIGNKPFMNYVTGVVMQFTTQRANEVIIKARGKFISRGVDIAEVSTKRFLDNTAEVKDIKIDSEEFENKEGKTVRVSTIEITLSKK